MSSSRFDQQLSLYKKLLIAYRSLKAFIIRDVKIQLSYRLVFVLRFLGVLFATASLFFLSQMIGHGTTPYLDMYGGDYFSFVLVGMILGSYMMMSLHDLAMTIRDGQLTGTLEGVLLTPVSIPVFLAGSLVWRFVMVTLSSSLYILVGVLMGLQLTCSSILLLLTTLILSIVSFLPFGILAASFVMVFKKGNPVAYVVGMLSNLLCGVMFPVSVLPDWLQSISAWIPLTHALHALRLILLQGASGGDVLVDLLFLFIFSLIAFPLSGLVFRGALRIAMSQGSLSYY